MEYRISVLIRTYNEETHLGDVLEILQKQTYTNFETILLDSGSTDRTLEIAKMYGVQVRHIPHEAFNYSYASNKLVEYATGDIVCFLSGHSVPVNTTYLADTNAIFQNPQVGACYGDVIALPDGSLTEKLFHRLGYIKNLLVKGRDSLKLETEIHPGIFSCCNASARRALLLRHPFVIELGQGGEDIEVAYRILQDGYYIAKVPDLLVMHSHGKPLLSFLDEYLGWKRMWHHALAYIRNHK